MRSQKSRSRAGRALQIAALVAGTTVIASRAIAAGVAVPDTSAPRLFSTSASLPGPHEAKTMGAAQAVPSACAAAPYRALDFWVGHWTVTDEKGQPAGESDIEKILDDCIVLEHWYGAEQEGRRFTGKAFHGYDPRLGKWQQFWVDNRPQSTIMIGVPQYGAMVYEWNTESNGKTVRHRATLSARAPNQVRHFGEVSMDDGKTWHAAYDLAYTRRG